MQPGTPPPGQDPYGQQPYSDPFGQPQYPPPPASGAPDGPYQTSASPYPTTGDPYQEAQGYEVQGPEPQQYELHQPDPAPWYPDYQGHQAPPQYAQPYQMAGYGAPPGMPAQRPSQVLAILSMIFGIISIPLLCCNGIGLAAGIAGVVCGIIGIKKANEGTASGKGMAIAGTVCGAITIVLAVAGLVIYGLAFVTTGHSSDI